MNLFYHLHLHSVLRRAVAASLVCAIWGWSLLLAGCHPQGEEQRSGSVEPSVGTAVAASVQQDKADPQGLFFNSERAWDDLRKQVEMGARPSGSEASLRLRTYITSVLEQEGWTVETQAFTAQTPLGPKNMANIEGQRLARRAPDSGKAPGTIILAAHYDTKYFDKLNFVGANDGASGVAVLLELARAVASLEKSGHAFKHDVSLLFLDGEEAFVEWSDEDSLYGSRHYVNRLAKEDRLDEILSVLVVDMVGDKDLRLTFDGCSHPDLLNLVFSQGEKLGYKAQFDVKNGGYVSDDHLPFLQYGIPAADIIGFIGTAGALYPPYWHTAGDTIDKVGPASLEAVGRTLESSLLVLDDWLAHP